MSIRLKKEPEPDFVKEMAELPANLVKLLFHRGIKNLKEAEAFLAPDYDLHTYDPKLLKDSEKAAKRIWQAILKKEKICIYSDYDADGIPGAVILHDFFKKINYQNFFNYIPHRNREGFGLNDEAVQKIYDKGAELLITIDCGIADVKPVNLANKLGMEVIITDHHEIGGDLPDAFAIVNPKQPDCNYPEKMLCGSAVIFKLVEVLLKDGEKVAKNHLEKIPLGWQKWLLDMVAIATISDMIPLVGENRVLAKYGLLVLKKTRRKGLLKLYRKNNIQPKNLNEDDIGFTIAPRINAASRMGEPEVAFTLLATNSDSEAEAALKELEKINNERKGTVASIVKEIKKDLKKNPNRKFLVKGNPNWSPSLMGLAANTIMEEIRCPVFLWGRGEGNNIKGSCRSMGQEFGQVNLVEVMKKISPEIMPEFGGHEKAGGFVLSDHGVFDFEGAIEKAINELEDKKMKNIIAEISREVDLKIDASEIDENLLRQINKLAPFGIENEKPLILFDNLIVEKIQRFGSTNNHLKIIFKKDPTNSYSETIEAIKFFFSENEKLSDFYQRIQKGEIVKINLIGHLEKSFFGYRPQIRVRIVDFW